ncbi:MAG: hypothetical protein ABWY29_04960 [Blastococcus sp.]
MTVLLVDVANVVGSRPDGWWRDRKGAAERLLTRLASLVGRRLPGPDGGDVTVEQVIAVVEGKARDATSPEGIRVVRAQGSGDDALAECAAALAAEGVFPLAVTADRGLRARLPAGTAVTGPGWLLAALDAADPPSA